MLQLTPSRLEWLLIKIIISKQTRFISFWNIKFFFLIFFTIKSNLHATSHPKIFPLNIQCFYNLRRRSLLLRLLTLNDYWFRILPDFLKECSTTNEICLLMTSSQLSVSRSLSIISFWTHALLLSVFHKDDQDLDPDKSPNAAIYKTSLGNMHTHKKNDKK